MSDKEKKQSTELATFSKSLTRGNGLDLSLASEVIFKLKKQVEELTLHAEESKKRAGMTLLAHDELVDLVESGVLKGAKREAINGTSIDLHLHGRIMIERQGLCASKIVDLSERDPLDMNQYDMDAEGYVLKKKEFILGATLETFYMPDNISAEYSLKSSLGRIGLNHMLAGWIDPGFTGSRLTLELYNATRYHDIRIRAGDPIGQVKFFRHAEVPHYASYSNTGRYNDDMQVTGMKK